MSGALFWLKIWVWLVMTLRMLSSAQMCLLPKWRRYLDHILEYFLNADDVNYNAEPSAVSFIFIFERKIPVNCQRIDV